MSTTGRAQRAEQLAASLLQGIGTRLAHVMGVAERAKSAGLGLADDEREWLQAAAWAHDIGYAPALAETGFHPLDGARFLARSGEPDVVCGLVAHHSGAGYEAEERGLGRELAEFPEPGGRLLDALVWADMTTGPRGERLTVDERIADILRRYPEGDPVHRAVVRATPMLRAAEKREERLRAVQAQPM